jgi:RimJ/RimL family protein N-acetyltransferase
VPSPYHREDAVAYLDKCEQERAEGKTFNFLAVDGENRILGSFGLMELDKAAGYGEIGYWVAKEARGKGVATRAVALLRDWAAGEKGCDLVELVIHTDNALSIRVAERTGFLATGERRTAPRQESATVLDHEVYAWRPS